MPKIEDFVDHPGLFKEYALKHGEPCHIPCYKPLITGCRRVINFEIDNLCNCPYIGIGQD